MITYRIRDVFTLSIHGMGSIINMVSVEMFIEIRVTSWVWASMHDPVHDVNDCLLSDLEYNAWLCTHLGQA